MRTSIPRSQMSSRVYNEEKVRAAYLEHNFRNLMTDFETRCYDLAIKREIATASESAADRLPNWIKQAGQDAIEPSLLGVETLRTQIEQRIACDLRDGRLRLNRCPRCHRIVKTSLSKQCLWCGYDWHKYVPFSIRPGVRDCEWARRFTPAAALPSAAHARPAEFFAGESCRASLRLARLLRCTPAPLPE